MQPKYHRTFLCGGVVLAVLNFRTKKSKPVMLLGQKVSIDLIGDRHELFKYNCVTLFMGICVMKFSIKITT